MMKKNIYTAPTTQVLHICHKANILVISDEDTLEGTANGGDTENRITDTDVKKKGMFDYQW